MAGTVRTASPGTAVAVRVLDPRELKAATVLLARAFAEEPGTVALLPDPDLRRVVGESSARNALRSTFRYGNVHGAMVGDDLAAIALWHPPGVASASLGDAARNAAAQLAEAPTWVRAFPHAASVVLRNAPAGLAMGRARAAAVARASRGPTWHLAFLGTAPEHRGRGLARAVLDRQLARCDEDGAPVWLETTDPVNPPIYERFGFETVRHIEDAAWLPGFWVMRREPRARQPR